VAFTDRSGRQRDEDLVDLNELGIQPPDSSTEASDVSPANSSQLGKPAPGVYSRSAGAPDKRRIDKLIENEGISVNKGSVEYWKRYIALASEGKVTVGASSGNQFVLVKNAMEGFLPSTYSKENADKLWVHPYNGGWLPGLNATDNADANDALVVFDKTGTKLLGVIQVAIPNEYPKTADAIKSWDNQAVIRYFNTNWSYDALAVLDDYKGRAHGEYWVDFHKAIGTHGCIQVDPGSQSTFDRIFRTKDTNKITRLMQVHDDPNKPRRPENAAPAYTLKTYTQVGTARIVGY
jgi:hypothetical protein